jgi:CheY-like chemotaxis protein
MTNRPSILLLDDDRQMAQYLKALLVQQGYSVPTATSSKKIPSVIQERLPKLLIMDLLESRTPRNGLDLALAQHWDLVIVALDLLDREGVGSAEGNCGAPDRYGGRRRVLPR